MEVVREGVVAVILNPAKDSVLMEARNRKQSYSGARMFFSGHVEEVDRRDTTEETHNATLSRELMEELGVCVEKAISLECKPQPKSPGGTVLYPYVVTLIGEIPKRTLDNNSRVVWERLGAAVVSPHESVWQIANATIGYINADSAQSKET